MNERACRVAGLAVLAALGAFSLAHLMTLPAFEDEGSQLRLIFRIIDAHEWLQPLNEGKPLEAWPMVAIVWLGLPPLPSIRAVHVIVGLLTVILTYRLALRVSQTPAAGRAREPGAAFASAALVAVCPFLVYLQRLALADTLMCAAGVWALIRAEKFIASPTPRRAAWLAAAWVVGAITKLPVGFVFLIHLPLALGLMSREERRTLLRAPVLGRVIAAMLPVAALLLTVGAVALWRLHRGQTPGFGLQDLLGLGGGGYRGIEEAIGIPRARLNEELAAQLTVPIMVIGGVGLCAGAWLGGWRERWLIAAGASPMLAIALLAQFWFSRYLLFTLPPLIVASVYGWRRLTARLSIAAAPITVGLAIVCLVVMGRQSALLILEPTAARWSPLDRWQYIEGWSSGYGYRQAAALLLTAAHTPQRIFALDGHSAYQLQSYLPPSWRPRVTYAFYADDARALVQPEARLQNVLAHAPAWIVIPEALLDGYLDSSFGRSSRSRFELKRIASFPKPDSSVELAIYEVTRSAHSRT